MVEREQFERDGYLLVPGALGAETVSTLLAVARHEDSRYRGEPGVSPHHVLNRHDLITRDESWLDLIDAQGQLLPHRPALIWATCASWPEAIDGGGQR